MFFKENDEDFDKWMMTGPMWEYNWNAYKLLS
jgi:hypothetical protein